MIRPFTAAIALTVLTGCASTDYQLYAQAQANIAAQRAAADQARYAALASIAQQGDSAAKVAAVMSMMQMGQVQPQATIAAPRSTGETLLQWASLVLPTATQMYGISRQSQVAIAQSDNATRLGIAQSGDASATQQAIVSGFVNVAGKVQGNSTVTNTSTSTQTATTTTTTNPTQVVTQDKVVLVDKPVIVDPKVITVEKPVVVDPKVVTVDKPVVVEPRIVQPTVVEPRIVQPTVVQVPTPAAPASAAGG
jgi:hypothetical protein